MHLKTEGGEAIVLAAHKLALEVVHQLAKAVKNKVEVASHHLRTKGPR